MSATARKAISVIDTIRAAESAEPQVNSVSDGVAEAANVAAEASAFQIFEDLERPTAKRVRASIYPWDKLSRVGLSFFAPNVKISTMTTNVSNRNKKGEEKYECWKHTVNGVAGVVVKRIK